MKKLWWLICVIIILIVVGIVVMISNKGTGVGEKPTGSGSNSTETENGSIKYASDKKFIYLVNNRVLATRVGNTWNNNANSTVTLKDIFSSEAFYLLSEQMEDAKVKSVIINRVEDELFNNIETYEKIKEKLKKGTLIKQTNNPVNYIGWNYMAYNYYYSLPAQINDNENVINLMSDCGPTIEVARDGFYSNDANLAIVEAEKISELSTNAADSVYKEYPSLDGAEIKGYSLNIDTDPSIEKVYIISNEFEYPVVESDKYMILVVENDEDVLTKVISELKFRSADEEEFWENYKNDWLDNIELHFCDFDHDGRLEIVLEGNTFERELPYYYELLKINSKNISSISIIQGSSY